LCEFIEVVVLLQQGESGDNYFGIWWVCSCERSYWEFREALKAVSKSVVLINFSVQCRFGLMLWISV